EQPCSCHAEAYRSPARGSCCYLFPAIPIHASSSFHSCPLHARKQFLSRACYSLSSPHPERWLDTHSVCRQLPIRCRGSRECCCIRSCPRRQLSSICSEQTYHLCGCRGRRMISPCFHLHS